jgi:2-amino-4-hydroxy-6-hydroxymethyldihydropteridine diphosphokinase
MTAYELLRILQRVEADLGRVRGERWGERTIDLDLLLYGDLVIDSPGLTLPHPRMHERRFVLEPLAEIEPRIVHPRFQQSVQELLSRLLHVA